MWIVDGRISCADAAAGGEVRRIDARGLFVAPGLMDLHVHFREPGREDAETMASGSAAAARGGFTHVVTMPNTTPAIATPEMVKDQKRIASGVGRISLLPSSAATCDRAGRALAPLAELAAAGAVAFTDDGTVIPDDLIHAVLEAAGELGLPVMEHALRRDATGVLHAGAAAELLGLPGIPREAEIDIVERDIAASTSTGGHIHIQHISAAESIPLIVDAAGRGIPVTAEVTPHHILLSDADLLTPNTNLKMSPPLRSPDDREALCLAVISGAISCLATDHAPHTAAAKSAPFGEAPFGVIGLETAIGATFTELVMNRGMNRMEWLRRWTTGPRQVLGLLPPSLRPGAPADLVVLDLDSEWEVKPSRFLSKSRNSPFIGRTFVGQARHTFLNGRLTWSGTEGSGG